MGFDDNIFINCPFDDTYLPLLHIIIFTTIYLGFTPRISTENPNSGEARIDKIVTLIEESRYAIHDLSRMRALKKREFFRLNMPFELGVDFGCLKFKGGDWSNKKLLVLDTEKYRYQKAISDLSGFDIEAHENEPKVLVSIVRNWLSGIKTAHAPGPTLVWGAYNDFMADLYDYLKSHGFPVDVNLIPVKDLVAYMREWVEKSCLPA